MDNKQFEEMAKAYENEYSLDVVLSRASGMKGANRLRVFEYLESVRLRHILEEILDKMK